MEHKLSRRRLLQIGGTGTALAISGCSTNSNDESGTSEGAESTEDTVSVAANIKEENIEEAQAEIEERQQDIQEDLDNEEISEQEAQIKMQQVQVEVQQEFIAESVNDIESLVAETDGLELSDSDEGIGMLLVEGDAESLIGLLSNGSVLALYAEEKFEEQLAQQEEAQSGQ